MKHVVLLAGMLLGATLFSGCALIDTHTYTTDRGSVHYEGHSHH